MPEYLEHLERLLKDWLNSRNPKETDFAQENNLKSLDEKEQKIVSSFGKDLFYFLIMQIDIIGQKVKGEIYIESIRVKFLK